LRFEGFSAHTGATPPNPEHRGGTLYRKDALVASSRATAALLKLDGVELIRSEPGKDTGFTSVPDDQIVELLVRTEAVPMLRVQLANQQSDAERYFGVKMTYAYGDVEDGLVTVTDKDDASAAVLFPAMTSVRSTSAYQREGTELGLTRATVTDFHLVAGTLRCKLDGRAVDQEAYQCLEEEIDEDLRMQFGTRHRVKVVSEKHASLVDTELTHELIAQARATSVGNRPLTWREMPSFPGHDLDRIIAAKIKGALLFLRHSGVSHNAGEDLPKKHLDTGLAVALPFMLEKLAA
jgi:acetylornithine deacetylase/succinyl-diaminopimelate desuccinylase-like protein